MGDSNDPGEIFTIVHHKPAHASSTLSHKANRVAQVRGAANVEGVNAYMKILSIALEKAGFTEIHYPMPTLKKGCVKQVVIHFSTPRSNYKCHITYHIGRSDNNSSAGAFHIVFYGRGRNAGTKHYIRLAPTILNSKGESTLKFDPITYTTRSAGTVIGKTFPIITNGEILHDDLKKVVDIMNTYRFPMLCPVKKPAIPCGTKTGVRCGRFSLPDNNDPGNNDPDNNDPDNNDPDNNDPGIKDAAAAGAGASPPLKEYKSSLKNTKTNDEFKKLVTRKVPRSRKPRKTRKSRSKARRNRSRRF
jgi:hypothetical protein